MDKLKNKSSPEKLTSKENFIQKEIFILLRFSNSGRSYTIKVPSTWTIHKLEEFIALYMKEEVHNTFYHLFFGGAKNLESPKEKLIDILKPEKNSLKLIIVSQQKKSAAEVVDSDKKLMYDDVAFENTEKIYINSYKEIINKSEEKSKNDQNFLFKMPLMHQGINQRLSSFNEKSRVEIKFTPDFENIENFSFRDYFKIELMFKLLFFFILFGIHMKGINLPIFIILLVIYYWYYLYMDISAFYDKKIGEIKMTKEEKKEVKDMVNRRIKEKENENNQGNIDASHTQELPNDISAKEDKLKLENEDIDYEENDIIVQNEELKNNQMKTITNLKDNEINDSYNKHDKMPEMEGISNLTKKYESKDKNLNIQIKDGAIKYYATFIFEILFTFVMSLFPFWYDEFEIQNPVMVQNNLQNNNETQETINVDNTNQNNEIQNENKLNQESVNSINNINSEDNNKRILTDEENDSLRPEIETINKNQKLPDYSKSQISERILIKSSNDTRLVNHSEDQNYIIDNKYILVDENESKTENEFVFSENVNIDTLSYNETILESLKKRNVKEHEETHFN